MRAVKAVLAQLWALFIDDGALALGIVAVVALAGAVVVSMPQLRQEAGAILLIGCLGLLIVNAIRAAQP
jgi:hypothetical protein